MVKVDTALALVLFSVVVVAPIVVAVIMVVLWVLVNVYSDVGISYGASVYDRPGVVTYYW